MNPRLRFWASAIVAAFFVASPAGAQTPPDQQAIYEKFRAWVTQLPPDAANGDIRERYRRELAAQGESLADIERDLQLIEAQGQRLEVERWNRILTAATPNFNTNANRFLVEMAQTLPPGKALDVGMGQGRNALFLAQRGWDVTGFDPAERAVAAAEAEAKRLGVKITTRVERDDEFEFGKARWDLVVMTYVSVRDLVPTVYDALKPGGLVVIEAFHRDATKAAAIGGDVVFDTNELLQLFDRFRIVRYEDTEDMADFPVRKTRVVRLLAQKPAAGAERD